MMAQHWSLSWRAPPNRLCMHTTIKIIFAPCDNIRFYSFLQAKVILGTSNDNSYSAALNRTSTLVREVTATDAWTSRKPHFWLYGSYQWGKLFAPGAAVLRDGPLTLVRLNRPHP